MKRNDFVLIIICAVIGILGLGFHYGVQRQGAYVTVSVDGEVIKTLSLSENQSYEILGYDGGVNYLVIEDGYAYLSDADCPDQICVKTGKISKVGETIVCLPHRVVCEVLKEGEDAAIDAVSN